nr:TIGR03086 family protein [Chloroflexia bacterium]
AAFAASSARFLAALRQPGALAQPVEMPFGTMPGQTIGMFRFVDFLVHGWDIAKVTGQPTDFAPELNETALAISRQGMAEFDRTSSDQFGSEQAASEGASAADRLAAFLGRTA